MDGNRVMLVVCITLFIVVGINAFIYAMVTRGKTVSQIELMRRAMSRARNPWEGETKDLEELSKRVAELSTDEEEQGEKEQ